LKNHLCLLFLFTSNLIIGQENTESKFWTTVGYIYQPLEKLTFGIHQLYRLKDNYNAVDTYITEFNTDYSLKNKLNLELELRYYYKNDNTGNVQGYENLWRYRLGVEKEWKIKPFKLFLRAAYQNRQSIDRNDKTTKYFRTRYAFEYAIKKWDWDPYFSFEYLSKLSGNKLKKYRFGFGSSNKVNGSKWTFRYYFETNKKRTIPDYHILSLKYRYKDKSKKIKKNKKNPETKTEV
tara:strand:+ start:16423 stop:17127 length:705 start_codon:yes stop_codon:yes gene_type:complete